MDNSNEEKEIKQSSNISLEAKIESLLYWKASPVKINLLSEILEANKESIEKSIETLEEKYKSDNLSGLEIIKEDQEIALVTKPNLTQIINKLEEDDSEKDLSKAALETLAIIIYRGPVTKSEIDYIRGVSSQYTLRTLSTRGFITRSIHKNNENIYTYKPTIEALQYLGISNKEGAPNYSEINKDIEDFIKTTEEKLNEDKDESK